MLGYHRKNEGTYQAHSSSVADDGGRSPPPCPCPCACCCSRSPMLSRSLSLAPAWPALRESGRRCLDRDDGTLCLLWQRGNGAERDVPAPARVRAPRVHARRVWRASRPTDVLPRSLALQLLAAVHFCSHQTCKFRSGFGRSGRNTSPRTSVWTGIEDVVSRTGQDSG